MDDEEIANLEAELAEISHTTPAKHYGIYITDEKRGINFKVDQSLDSHITGKSDAMKQLLDMMWGAREYFKTHTYEQCFSNGSVKEIKINGFLVKFEGVEGKDALTLFLRYINNLLNQLEKSGNITFKKGSETKVS